MFDRRRGSDTKRRHLIDPERRGLWKNVVRQRRRAKAVVLQQTERRAQDIKRDVVAL